jgi:hypothetical protein
VRAERRQLVRDAPPDAAAAAGDDDDLLSKEPFTKYGAVGH